MTDEIGSIVGIKEQTEADDSYMLQVGLADRIIEVRIKQEHIPSLLAQLQSAAMTHAQEKAHNLNFPELEVQKIGLAHREREVALLVSTDQIGTLVLRMTDRQRDMLMSELQRMKTYRSAPPSTQ